MRTGLKILAIGLEILGVLFLGIQGCISFVFEYEGGIPPYAIVGVVLMILGAILGWMSSKIKR